MPKYVVQGLDYRSVVDEYTGDDFDDAMHKYSILGRGMNIDEYGESWILEDGKIKPGCHQKFVGGGSRAHHLYNKETREYLKSLGIYEGAKVYPPIKK